MLWQWRGAASWELVIDKSVDKYGKKLFGNFPNDNVEHFYMQKLN